MHYISVATQLFHAGQGLPSWWANGKSAEVSPTPPRIRSCLSKKSKF